MASGLGRTPLDPQRWQKLTDLFDRLAGLPAAERSARLLELCDDETLRAQAESLLCEAEREGPLDRSAAELVAPWLEGIDTAAGDEALGQRVGQYRLVEELGRGGMGVVYLAERADGHFEQEVAVKLVKRGLDTDEVLERFRRERQILARLDHAAIARLLDGGATQDGRPYFAMEHVIGEPITVYCDRRRLSIEQRLELFRKTCEAVEHAHVHLVVHRDLKPSNILVTAEGNLKLLDFGVAKLLDGGAAGPSVPTLTRTGLRAMTPEYAAPEQVRGEPVSARTDVYALGVVLYELMTGRRPYRIGPLFDAQAERTILEVEPRRPSSVGPAALRRRLSGDLDAITLMALRKQPERRYASARALAEDIARHLAKEPVNARRGAWSYRAGRLARRHPAVFGIAALVVGIVAAATIVERDRRAVRRAAVRQCLARGMSLAAEGDALGALPWVARALEAEPDAARREDDRLRIGTLLEYAPRLLRQWAHGAPVVMARFSPDGTKVVTASDDGTARVWDVTSDEPLVVPLRHQGRVSGIAFSPDGRRIVTAGEDGKVGVWDTATGALVRWLVGDERAVSSAEFSPSGRRVLAFGAGGTRLWDPVSGRLVAAYPGANRGACFDRQGRRFAISSEREAGLWDAETGLALGPAVRPVAGIDWTGAALSADGRRMVAAAAAGGRCATVWDAETGRTVANLCPGAPVNDAGFDGPGRRVFVYAGASVSLWELADPSHPVASFEHADVVLMGVSNGRRLLTVTTAGAFVWDLDGRRRIGPLRHSAPIRFVELDPSDRYLLTASDDGTARLWDLAGGELTPAVSMPLSARGGSFSKDGKRYLAVAGAFSHPTRGFQQLVDLGTGEPLVPPLRHGGGLNYVGYLPWLFSPDESRIVSGGADRKVRVWSAETGEPLLTLSLEAQVTDVAFTPDGRRIAAAAGAFAAAPTTAPRREGSAQLWDAVTGLSVGQGMAGLDAPVTLSFSPDGLELATCGDGVVALWDATSGRPRVPAWRSEEMKGTSSAYRCRFSPDGRWLLTGGRSLHLWDARTGAAGATPPGVSGSFSPRGERLATMLGTTGIAVWSVEAGRPVVPTLETHDLQQSVHFSSDGRWVLASGTAPRVWDAGDGTVLAVLDRRSWATGGWSKGAFFLPGNSGIALGEIVPDEGPASRLMVWRFARDERPVPELVELSNLLAGYRVVSEAGAPVALTPEEMKNAWERLGEVHGRSAALPADKVVAWHRGLGEELAEEGRYAEALLHFDAAVALGPPRATVLERRGNLKAELGRLEEAEADFGQAARLRPGFPDLVSHAALLRAARGDAAGHRQIASDLLRQSGNTQNPDRAYWIARTCVLVPDDAALDRGLAVRLADVALPLSGKDAEVLDLRGAALYRAGRYVEARERLLAAVRARSRATAWEAAFLAMTNGRMNAASEGRRWLVRGTAAAAAAAKDGPSSWTERLEGQALLAQARDLLGVK